MKKSIALVAVCATALSPIFTTPAYAADPTPSNAAIMQANCAAFVTTNYGPITPSLNSTYYSFEVDFDGVDADPVFDPATRVNDETTWTPDLTSARTLNGPDASQSTQLRRNGKSPNIFATDVRASSETWSNNSVEYNIDGTVTTTFTYQCDVTEHEWTPPTPARFTYKLKPGSPANDDCSRFDDDFDHPNYGQARGNCVVDTTIPGAPGFFTLDDLGLVGAFAPIEQTSDPETYGPFLDPNAGPHTYFDTNALGHAVVCISPGSKGGEWRAQNGYGGLGGACSTATFNGIPPGTPIPSNSLPVS
ncbi:hypothetical protein [Tsuneonella sp. SYSU-LHT278]|uniref:hypothetical protein n=1 Tax=Tsuneonella sediminis TaxID=3416089 RepID=UPI003F79326C